MDNTISISEIRRRGMAAISDSLRLGPVQVVKRNKSVAVILSVSAYRGLVKKEAAQLPAMSAVEWLMAQSSTGNKSREAIDAELQAERDW